VIECYKKAFNQLGDVRFLKPLGYSVGLAIMTSLAVLPLGYFGFEWLNETFLAWLESDGAWWASTLLWTLRILELLLMLVILFFLFGSIQVAYLGLFVDGVVEAAAEKHHPDLKLNPPPPMVKAAWGSSRLLALSLLINLFCLPIFIIGWFLPPLGLIAQVLANGYLLGKEYEDAVAPRLPQKAKLPLKEKTIFGSIAAGLMLIPLVNFIAPVLAAAAMIHYLEARR